VTRAAGGPVLTRSEVDRAVAAERRALADLVSGLDARQWETPSLCDAWTVRHVIAHLTYTTRARIPAVVWAAIRARGSFDRMEIAIAADRAARFRTDELVAQLRESADSNRRMPASTPMDPLMDVVIHGQDVARPLGVHHVSPPTVVAACLAYVAGNSFMGGPRRLAGLRVVSSDSGWSTGSGPEVSGPDLDLLLAVAGRRAGLAALSGPGLTQFSAQL